MTSIAATTAPSPQVVTAAVAAPTSPKPTIASGSNSAPSAGPAATVQLSQQALAKLQAQAKAQGDSDWRPGQRPDFA